ncbi:MAG: PAS domain S-box protein [Bacteroidota bacterium]
MAEAISVMEEDKRLKLITEQIIRLANADFETPGELSEEGDDLDSIVVGLNLLGEELEAYTQELKAKEEKIKNTLIQLNEAQHLSQIGSWEWIVSTNTVTWTDELYRIYGRDKETFQSTFENFNHCIHPDEKEYVNSVIQSAYQNKTAFKFSHRIIRPDGKEAFLDCKGNVYLDEDGTLLRMTGTAQDVTELKKAEEKIVKLASIVESSNDAIISKTIDSYITSWNKQAQALFGYTEQEVLGKHISLLFPPDQVSEENEIIAKVVGEGKPLINYESIRRKKDGTLVNIAATISPIKDPSGKVIAISKIARDITEKKQAEEKLKKYTIALEQKNKESEQFAYITSHDLQEPLRTITNYIGLFHDDYKGQLDERADIYIKFITNASRRMQTLISDLLEYTRIENDKEATQIDCTALVNEIMMDLERTINENNATIVFGTLPVITGYFSRIKSLFQNLIVNAIKFKRSGVAPIITITAKDTETDWLFEIKDNGIGIEKAYHEKIFMMFQRLHAREEYNGTGIGLAHCKKIVELRGGNIWVESQPGIGSSFFFTLPKNLNL